MRISEVALLCRLSGHKADAAGGRWNASICFGRCARCGRDLVRGADGGWRVPRGYRVVWRAMVEDDATPATTAERPEPEAAEPLESETPPAPAPAEQLEANLETPAMMEWPLGAPPSEPHADAPCADREAEPVPVAEEPVVEAVEAEAPDFMDDEADDFRWDDAPEPAQRSALA